MNGKFYAVKIPLKQKFKTNEKLMRYMEKECNSHKLIKSEYVVQIIEYFQHDDNYIMVLEYCN